MATHFASDIPNWNQIWSRMRIPRRARAERAKRAPAMTHEVRGTARAARHDDGERDVSDSVQITEAVSAVVSISRRNFGRVPGAHDGARTPHSRPVQCEKPSGFVLGHIFRCSVSQIGLPLLLVAMRFTLLHFLLFAATEPLSISHPPHPPRSGATRRWQAKLVNYINSNWRLF